VTGSESTGEKMPVITKPKPLKSKPEGMTRRELYEVLEANIKRDQTIILNELIAMRKANDIAVSNGVFTLRDQ
jgi:hypothetical protein